MSHQNQPIPSPRQADAVAYTAASALQLNGVVFPSASRTNATYTSEEIHNPSAKGLRLFTSITDDGAAGTVTAEVQVKDPVSETWKRITGAVTAALTETGSPNTLVIYPGVIAAANTEVNNQLGPVWRVVAVVAANAVTFSIGADYLI